MWPEPLPSAANRCRALESREGPAPAPLGSRDSVHGDDRGTAPETGSPGSFFPSPAPGRGWGRLSPGDRTEPFTKGTCPPQTPAGGPCGEAGLFTDSGFVSKSVGFQSGRVCGWRTKKQASPQPLEARLLEEGPPLTKAGQSHCAHSSPLSPKAGGGPSGHLRWTFDLPAVSPRWGRRASGRAPTSPPVSAAAVWGPPLPDGVFFFNGTVFKTRIPPLLDPLPSCFRQHCSRDRVCL